MTASPTDGSRQSAAAQQQGGFPFGYFLVCSLALCFAVMLRGIGDISQRLSTFDSDDVLRLVQVRAYIDGAAWHDVHLARLAPPEGFQSHWSRIPDVMMAAIYRASLLVVPSATAELAMRTLYPLGLLLVASMSAMSLTYMFFRKNIVAVLVFVIAFCSTAATQQYLPGRIDHHGIQIALVITAMLTALHARDHGLWAAATAALSAVLLAIGLESLIFVLLPAGLLAFRYIRTVDARRPLLIYALTLVPAILLALFSTTPLARWTETACDMLASNLAFGIAAGGLALAGALVIPALQTSAATRIIGLIIAAGVAAGVCLAMNPQCIHGPYGNLPVGFAETYWTGQTEGDPLFIIGNWDRLISNSPLYAYLVFVLLGCAWLLMKREFRRNEAFILLLLGVVISIALAQSEARVIYYAGWLSVPLACLIAITAWHSIVERKCYVLAPLLLLLLPLVPDNLNRSFLELFQEKPVATQTASAGPTVDDCNRMDQLGALAALPKGLVLSRGTLNTNILALTPHSVYAAGYHRVAQHNVNAENFYDKMTPEEAYAFVVASSIDYIAVCAAEPPQAKPGSMQATLGQPQPAPWLERLTPENSIIHVFKVKK
jgi:hypothetical protein